MAEGEINIDINKSLDNKNSPAAGKVSMITPAVLIALITAIVGPLSLYYFEDINQKRKLQEQLLSKIFDHTVDGASNEVQLDKLAIILALVQDNEEEFGLSFPSTEDILDQRKKLVVQRLESDLATRTAEAERALTELGNAKGSLSVAKSEIELKETKIEKINDQIEFLNKNRAANIDLINQLSSTKQNLQTAINTSLNEIQRLKEKESSLAVAVSNLNETLKTSQNNIALLTERNQEGTAIIEGLKKTIADKERENQDFQKTLAELEKKNNHLAEQIIQLKAENSSLIEKREHPPITNITPQAEQLGDSMLLPPNPLVTPSSDKP